MVSEPGTALRSSRPFLVPVAVEVALFLEQPQVFVDGAEAGVAELVPDLSVGWRDAVFLLVLGYIFEHRLLAFGEVGDLSLVGVALSRHGRSLGVKGA